MEYNRIIAVTGLPGLFELMASKTDGAIVRSLEDQSTKFVSSRKHNFSHLESIEIYTKRDNVNLVEIFKAMKAAGGKLPEAKDNNGLKAYFETTFPDMDFERVYASDMKKMVKWYEVLTKNGVEIKLSQPQNEEEEQPVQTENVAEPVTVAPEAEDPPKPKRGRKKKTEE